MYQSCCQDFEIISFQNIIFMSNDNWSKRREKILNLCGIVTISVEDELIDFWSLYIHWKLGFWSFKFLHFFTNFKQNTIIYSFDFKKIPSIVQFLTNLKIFCKLSTGAFQHWEMYRSLMTWLKKICNFSTFVYLSCRFCSRTILDFENINLYTIILFVNDSVYCNDPLKFKK